MKRYLLILLKFVVSIGLLVYLFHSKIDIHRLKQIFHESNLWLVLLCMILYGLGQVLSTYKWSLLIHSHGLRHPFQNLVSYYYVGMFFNLFMPSIVGGDIQRCYAVYRDEKLQSGGQLSKGRLPQIISSVMMERTTGIVAMIGLANISYFFFFRKLSLDIANQDRILKNYLPLFLIILLFGTIIGLCSLFLFRNANSETSVTTGFISRIIHSLHHIANQLKNYLLSPNLLFKVMIISFVFQSMMVIINILLGMALGLNVSLSYYFIIVPLITIWVALLPISIGGLGVRETAYVYLLQFANVDGAHAILLSFSFVIVIAVNALIGGIILLKRGFSIEKEIVQEK